MPVSPLPVDLLDLDGVLDSFSGRARQGKFVLIAHGAKCCLVAGSVANYRYHAGLVDAYCTRNSVPSVWLKEPELLKVLDDRVRVLGGGWIETTPASGLVLLHGTSKAYGPCHGPVLERIAADLTMTHEYKFVVQSK